MAEPAGVLRRIWRKFYWLKDDRRVRRIYRGIRHAVYFGGDGIGDELLCSAPLHELRRRGESGLGVLTTRPEFFHHSPDVDFVRPMVFPDLPFLARIGLRATATTYIHDKRPPDIDVPPPRHLIAEMCRQCGLTGEVELRPHLWLTPSEREAATPYRHCLVIQSSRRGASLAIGNKEWIPERFQAVVDALAGKYRIVQVGQAADPLLHGAEDLRGKTTLRQTAALLSQAHAFVGLVGLLMHLARAVDCPAVIIYGGREHPAQSGYPCNENLYTPLPCAPCWRWNSCDHSHACMTAIEPGHVVAALGKLLRRPPGPLAVARATL